MPEVSVEHRLRGLGGRHRGRHGDHFRRHPLADAGFRRARPVRGSTQHVPLGDDPDDVSEVGDDEPAVGHA